MENRFITSLANKEYYVAQQILISHGQRLNRSGKHSMCLEWHVKGLKSLFTDSECSKEIIKDVLERFNSLLSEPFFIHFNGYDFEEMCKLLSHIDERAGRDWFKFALFLEKNLSLSSKVTDTIISNPKLNDRLDYFLECHSGDISVFSKIFEADMIGEENIFHVGIFLIANKKFKTLHALTKLFAEKSGEFELVNDVYVFKNEQLASHRFLNFFGLLSSLLYCQDPSEELMEKLLNRYPNTIDDVNLKKIKSIFFAKPLNPQQQNPFASILQQFMKK